MISNQLSKHDDEAALKVEDVTPSSAKMYGNVLVGKTVQTIYGKGYVTDCRDEGGYLYTVQLTRNSDNGPLAILHTRDLPIRIKTPQDEAQELNVAYEAQEKMRRMNLEMECFENGVSNVLHDHCTTCLLQGEFANDQTRFPRLQKFVDSARETAATASVSGKASVNDRNNFPLLRKFAGNAQEMAETASKAAGIEKNSFPRLRKLWGSSNTTEDTVKKTNKSSLEQEEKTVDEVDDRKPKGSTKKKSQRVMPRIQNLLDERQKSIADPCLICGNPVCSAHASANFRKEGISMCLSCERLFELDFITECVSMQDPSQRAKRIDHMIDCYDRCLLVLNYSMQFVEQIAEALEQKKEQQNKIGLGSSGVGVVSGVLGIAAAATILTPAGPPLLIASLFFGGSATAVQTGTEALNYFSEPNKLADRIIALHGMVLSILRVTSTLRDAMMRNHVRTDVFEVDRTPLSESVQMKLENNKASVLAASNMGRAATLGSVAGAEGAAVSAGTAASASARGATAFSRAGTAAARTVRFARFAGGALSAAVLVMEANAIQTTIKDIHNGSPCDKAAHIRAIAEEIKCRDIPSTSELDNECQSYLKVLANRPVLQPVVSVEEADPEIADEFPEAPCTMVEQEEMPAHEGILLVAGEDAPVANAVSEESSRSRIASSFFGRGSSRLFESLSQSTGSTRPSVPVNASLQSTSRPQPQEEFPQTNANANLRQSELNLLM